MKLIRGATHPGNTRDIVAAARRDLGHIDDASVEEVTTLLYELLDAHADTAHLAAEFETDPTWAAHLDYLRKLQRIGRRVLAEMSVEDRAGARRTSGTRSRGQARPKAAL